MFTFVFEFWVIQTIAQSVKFLTPQQLQNWITGVVWLPPLGRIEANVKLKLDSLMPIGRWDKNRVPVYY